jgi:hypothetical protein
MLAIWPPRVVRRHAGGMKDELQTAKARLPPQVRQLPKARKPKLSRLLFRSYSEVEHGWKRGRICSQTLRSNAIPTMNRQMVMPKSGIQRRCRSDECVDKRQCVYRSVLQVIKVEQRFEFGGQDLVKSSSRCGRRQSLQSRGLCEGSLSEWQPSGVTSKRTGSQSNQRATGKERRLRDCCLAGEKVFVMRILRPSDKRRGRVHSHWQSEKCPQPARDTQVLRQKIPQPQIGHRHF